MERREGEKYKSFLSRVISSKASGNITYDEMGDLLVSDNRWVSENWRKAFYVLKEIVKELDTDVDFTENDLLLELESIKAEIYKEKVKLRDQRRELNKLNTNEARFENLRDVLIERMEDIGSLPQNINKGINIINTDVLGACLLLSDIHFGIKIDNQFNYYDAEECERRLNVVIDKTIHYCKMNGVAKLNVELLGDAISGIIQTGCRVAQEEDIIEQIVQISELLANGINKLKENINEVVVYNVYGNHGRVSANKKESIDSENFERLISEFIRLRVKNIKVIDGKGADFIKYNDFGRTFVLTHGHSVKGSNPINDFEGMLGCKVDCLHMGHWHSYKESCDQDREVVVNGSLVASDEYALSIKKNAKPMQVLKVYYKEDDATFKIFAN